MKSALEIRSYCLVSSLIGKRLLAQCLAHSKGLFHVIYADGDEEKAEDENKDKDEEGEGKGRDTGGEEEKKIRGER